MSIDSTIAELNSQDGKMGRTAADLNYRPLVLLVDEIGAILATMAPKSQKEMIESLVAIIMKGRSVGVHVVLATQDPRLIHSKQNPFTVQYSDTAWLG